MTTGNTWSSSSAVSYQSHVSFVVKLDNGQCVVVVKWKSVGLVLHRSWTQYTVLPDEQVAVPPRPSGLVVQSTDVSVETFRTQLKTFLFNC